jgi:hypothetical protein
MLDTNNILTTNAPYNFDDFILSESNLTASTLAPVPEKAITPAQFFKANAPKVEVDIFNVHWKERVKKGFNKLGEPNYLTEDGTSLVEGIYTDIPNELYHALPALSSSALKTFSTSPAHYHRQYISEIDRTRTVAQQRTLDGGTLAHELVLEPLGFYDRWAVALNPLDYPGALKTIASLSEKCKELGLVKSGAKDVLIKRLTDHDPLLSLEIWDLIMAEHEESVKGRELVDHIVWEDSHRAAVTTRKNDVADKLFSDGLPELTILSFCPINKCWLKCRPDWLRYDDICADYKTTRDSSSRAFAKQSKDLSYPIQQEFYKYVMSLQSIDVTEFIFIACEYLNADICEVYDLDALWTEKSHIAVMALLEEITECTLNDEWYGYNRKNKISSLKEPWGSKPRNSSKLSLSVGESITEINKSLMINPF